MTRNLFLTSLLMVLMAAVGVNAQGFGPGDGTGECQFIDEDGDGFNDLAPDADGDGIPNGQDPDWVKPEDGTGNQHKYQHGLTGETGGGLFGVGHLFAYAHAFAWKGEHGTGQASGPGHAYGPGDGTGTAIGPNDGTGFGPGDGTGDCDGSGNGGADANRTGRR